MTLLRFLMFVLGVCIISLLACAPSMPVKHGMCKFYVDGTSDTMDSTQALLQDGSSSSSSSSASSASSASGSNSTSSASSSSSSSSASGAGASGKFTTTKKKKNVKCYEYEDGSRDKNAVLKPGVTYTASASSSG